MYQFLNEISVITRRSALKIKIKGCLSMLDYSPWLPESQVHIAQTFKTAQSGYIACDYLKTLNPVGTRHLCDISKTSQRRDVVGMSLGCRATLFARREISSEMVISSQMEISH